MITASPMPTSGQGRFELPPLAAYVHIPWCVRKCPYCDFNSHAAGPKLPEDAYVAALLADLRKDRTLRVRWEVPVDAEYPGYHCPPYPASR